ILFTRGLLYCSIVSGLLLSLTPQASADFLFTTIDVPGSRSTVAAGINASGQIVGQYSDAAGVLHGFLLHGGSYYLLDVPAAHETVANGINATGQIVGAYGNLVFAGPYHGFVYGGSSYTSLDAPGSSRTEPLGINASSQIVGFYYGPGGIPHG